MIPDTVLKCQGLDVLTQHLGIVEAERFISLILREPFDYTEWQKIHFSNITLEKFNADAAIDTTVYELYNLTEEEIKIVEGE